MRIVIVPVLLAIFAIQSILSISIDIPDPEEQVLNTLNECLDDIEGVSNGIESFKTLIEQVSGRNSPLYQATAIKEKHKASNAVCL